MKKNNNFYDLIISRRSIRIFRQKEIPKDIVKKAINSARLSPSAANLQFLEYLVIRKKSLRDKVFPHTRWAGYIWPRRTPSKGQEPTLYIIILVNRKKSKTPDLRDIGAAAENILLSLLSYGVGSCWLASIDRKALRKTLIIPSNYEIDSLIAAGFPAESPKLEDDSANIKYWLDNKNILHLPKRPLKSILHLEKISVSNSKSRKK